MLVICKINLKSGLLLVFFIFNNYVFNLKVNACHGEQIYSGFHFDEIRDLYHLSAINIFNTSRSRY